MQVITGNKTIDYSLTAGGSFMRVITLNTGQKIIHSAKDTEKMLGLMMYDEAEKARAEYMFKLDVLRAGSFWELHDQDTISCHFNIEHYKKYLQAKSKLTNQQNPYVNPSSNYGYAHQG